VAHGAGEKSAVDGQGLSNGKVKAYRRPRTVRRDDLYNSSFRLRG